ncbi:hypothetical protein I312_105207 [Cryptococcus bacillisporus CA1280]|uniref:uncharacterized protein n=1 Tax=Cryptococcus bacillisporus CA1280 TaxID=1296109 RepID=UPI0033690978
MSLKRYRDNPPSPSPSPPAKLSHLPTPRPYTCTLPPTCHVHHTHYHSQYHLERHHDIFHRWVCTASVRVKEDHAEDIPQSFVAQRGWKKWRECLKVFPEERLLDLHYTETHDLIARERQKNGEKIFECFLPPDQCGKVFTNPKNRRLHMISKHRYPTQYFWSITNHGINEIARQDGLGFSLIRPKLDLNSAQGQEEGNEMERERGHHGQPRGPPSETPVLGGPLSRPRSRSLSPLPVPSPAPGRIMTSRVEDKDGGDMEMEDLTHAMSSMSSSLSFLPRGVRKSKSGRPRGGRGLDM